jgi:transposase
MRLPLPTGRILVYGKPVDMRKGFDGLTALVRQGLKEDPLSGDLFLFLGRSGKLSKALLWDRTGFVVIAKRLEKGSFRLRNQAEKLLLTPQALELLLDGIPAGGADASSAASGQ